MSRLPSSSFLRICPSPSASPVERDREYSSAEGYLSWIDKIVGVKKRHSSSGCAVSSRIREGASVGTKRSICELKGRSKKVKRSETANTGSEKANMVQGTF